jgi:hypothetical protein
MYQVFCLMNTPPTTLAEQHRCLASRTRCWRLAAAEAQACGTAEEPPRRARRPA